MASFLDTINPNVALATSIIVYPLLFLLISPSARTASHFMKTREAISVFHCILVVSAVLFELHRQHDNWVPPVYRCNASTPGNRNLTLAEEQALSRPKIIDAAPPFTNAIIAFECGYLIQDFAVLVLGSRRVARDGRARSVMARNFNWRVLGWHHLGLACALGLFHLRALRGQAKGSLVVLMMLLMNGSTPIGTLHWFLVKFHPTQRLSIVVTHGLYLATYALVRVYLLYGILKIFGEWSGQSALEAFTHLRWQCQLGTGTIGVANTVWLLIGTKKFIRRWRGSAKGVKSL